MPPYHDSKMNANSEKILASFDNLWAGNAHVGPFHLFVLK